MKFTPQFDDSLFVFGFGRSTPINPQLCATPLSAHQLADQLADLRPIVVMDYPMPFAQASPFFLSAKVPYLKFPSGYCELAGAIQMWWVRVPEPEGLALRYCKNQLAADEAAWIREQEALEPAA